jgi:hypothetical protein
MRAIAATSNGLGDHPFHGTRGFRDGVLGGDARAAPAAHAAAPRDLRGHAVAARHRNRAGTVPGLVIRRDMRSAA